MTYLERYRSGEQEAVWTELVALGEQVRQEPVLSDARAVARETMTRVQTNIDLLYGRLKDLGYRFEAQSSLIPPPPDIVQQLDAFETEVGPLPLSLRAWAEIVGLVNFMGSYPGLASYGASTTSGFMNLVESDFASLGDFIKGLAGNVPADVANLPPEKLQNLTDQLRQMVPPSMLNSLKGQIKAEKEKSFLAPPTKPILSDPLVADFSVWRLLGEWEAMQDDPDAMVDRGAPAGRFFFPFAPDRDIKSNFSGVTYDVLLPAPEADSLIHHDELNMTFVSYLRRCFQWGGFPGLAHYKQHPDDLLNRLKDGLLAI